MKTTAEALVPQVIPDKIVDTRWNPRAVDIYKSGTSFDAVAATSSEGTSTTCTSASATVECSGFSTPKAGYVPFFYITCGASSYLGPDPYYYTPGNGDYFSFPGMSNNNTLKVRSYLCEGETVRPTWKLIGWFDASTCLSSGAGSGLSYDDNICVVPTPTQAPTSPPTGQPTTRQPTPLPTAQPVTPDPTALTTGQPTPNPTALPTGQPTTLNPTALPTGQPVTPDPTPLPTGQPTLDPNPVLTGWYVDEDRCVSGVSLNESMHPSASACCSAHLSFMDNELCVSLSTGIPTNKFYADQSASVCRQDCPPGNGLPCGGSPQDTSLTLYNSLALCCASKIAWEPSCVDKSNGNEPQGTGKYYVNWSYTKCALDCPEDPALGCGGLASSWDTKYDTQEACTAVLNWVPEGERVYGQ